MKIVKKIILLALLAGAGAAAWFWFAGSSKTWYAYRTQPVTRGAITVSVSATGTVNPVDTVDVGTQVSGKIQEIYVDYNSVVKKGQLIALLDQEVLQSQVDQSRASLTTTQASAASARANLTNAQRTYERDKQLFERKLIARSEVDNAETALLQARANVAETNARVAQAQASLKQAQTNLGYSRITSPVDGVVISRQVDVGQTVAASMSTPTLFSIAKDLKKMNIEVTVDEADIGRVTEGQEAVCKFDAWPDDSFGGTVAQVRLEAKTISNVVTYTVVINIDNSDLKLKPGMTANVTIITEKKENVLRVSAAALRFSPPSDELPKENGGTNGTSSTPLGMMPPMRMGSQNRSSAQKVWLIENGRLAGSVEIAKAGVSDRTWVEVPEDTPLKEGQELAISFSKETGPRPADAAASSGGSGGSGRSGGAGRSGGSGGSGM